MINKEYVEDYVKQIAINNGRFYEWLADHLNGVVAATMIVFGLILFCESVRLVCAIREELED